MDRSTTRMFLELYTLRLGSTTPPNSFGSMDVVPQVSTDDALITTIPSRLVVDTALTPCCNNNVANIFCIARQLAIPTAEMVPQTFDFLVSRQVGLRRRSRTVLDEALEWLRLSHLQCELESFRKDVQVDIICEVFRIDVRVSLWICR